MQDKVWYASKTVWLNVLGTLLTVLTSADVMPLIPPKYAPGIAGLVAVLNIVLRSMKSQQGGALTLTSAPTDVIRRTGLVVLLAAALVLTPACAAKATVFANPTAAQVQATHDAALKAMNAVDTSLVITGEVLANADVLQRAGRLTADQLRGVTSFARDYARAAQTALKELKEVASEPSRHQTLARLWAVATPYIDKLAQSDSEGLRAFAVALRVVLSMSSTQ